jgi:Co/Zn/Cd efflux system component
MFKSLLTIHFINDIVSSVIGISANLLAIYVVRKRTAKEMRQYSQSLMQNCTFDLLMNIVVLITKEVEAFYKLK